MCKAKLLLLMSILSIGCHYDCRLKEKGYYPQDLSSSGFESLQKRKYSCSNKCKKVQFKIHHECKTINPKYFIVLVSSGDILICQKYADHIEINIDSAYFHSGKNLQIQLFDPELNQVYIWSKDSPTYIGRNSNKIAITLNEKISSESEFNVNDN